MSNPKFKGNELLEGDVIDFDGTLYVVKDPISESFGVMERLAGIPIPYPKLWQRVLCKLGFIAPNYWRDKIVTNCNNLYTVVGSGVEHDC